MSFDPGTLMLIAGATKAVGSIMAGEGNAKAAEYNAAVAQQNAAIAREQGVAAADAQWRGAQRTFGSIKASFGASGVQSDNGSPLDVLMDSARNATLDNLTTKYNYELKAVGFQNQATLETMKAQNSRTSGVLNAAGSMMTAYAAYSGMKIPGFGPSNPAGGEAVLWDSAGEIGAEEAAVALA